MIAALRARQMTVYLSCYRSNTFGDQVAELLHHQKQVSLRVRLTKSEAFSCAATAGETLWSQAVKSTRGTHGALLMAGCR
jgi:hypothetical protein